jgi:S-adenosylmethionine/arginine decarboxylase-like enzyme
MALYHKHLIIRTEVNNPPVDPVWTTTWLAQLVQKIGMKILMGPYTTYCEMEGNRGLTGVVIIETSHIALHSWDEANPAMIQLDVYTCGPLDTNLIFDELKIFDPVKVEYKYLDREHNLKEVDL